MMDAHKIMAKISDITEAKIKAAMRIEDVLSDQGVTLRRNGANLMGLCPFHEDRTVGSFQVSLSKNICSCYACGEVGLNPVDTLIRLKYQHLSEKEAYPAALRYLAAMYNIYVDEEEAPKVEHKAPRIPQAFLPKLQTIYWTHDLCKPFVPHNDKNPLLGYLRSLPLMEGDKARLEKAITNYVVGTYPSERYEGWTIWWLIDQFGYVRSGKMMCYKADGHRDKSTNMTWVHSQLARANKYNQLTHEPDLQCLFGQHLVDLLPKAIIRIVESEKTALICSAFTDMKQVLWLATGGMQRLNDRMLKVLMDKGRYIELYPDYDGYPDWEKKVEANEQMRAYRDQGMLVISSQVKDLWKPEDGGKADIADIMIRIVLTQTNAQGATQPQTDKTYEMACAKLGVKEHDGLRDLIGKLDLKIL